MKILKSNKKSSFKGTLLKIGLCVLGAFMIFGAMKSCIKVKAEVTSLQDNQMYTWQFVDINNNYWNDDYIGNIFVELCPLNTFASAVSCTFSFSSNDGRIISYNGIQYAYLIIDQYVYNNGRNVERRIYYSNTTDTLDIYREYDVWDADNSSWDATSYGVVSGISPYFVLLNSTLSLSVTGISGSFSPSLLYYYLSFVATNSGVDLYQEGYLYGYNKALSEFDSSLYWSNGYNTGYDNGYQDGLNDPHNPLLSAGYRDGYDDGYNDGLEDSPDNPYTFKNLFLSALEAPVTIIGSALNFNFLGYNMKDFVFSMFTIAILAFILRKLI